MGDVTPGGGRWEPITTWEAEQPQRCSICDEVYVGRELGYLPNMCDDERCPGPTDRRTVTVHV